jgi:hypothetical protein
MRPSNVKWTATITSGRRKVFLSVEELIPQCTFVVSEKDTTNPKSKLSEVENGVADSIDEAKSLAEEVARDFLADEDLKIPATDWKLATK